MTTAALIARTQNDIAIMLEGRATAARDRAIAVARRLIADATAEAEAADEIIRVRGLTPAQTRWLHDPTLGHSGAYKLTAYGTTWVEGTRRDLWLALEAAEAAGEGMCGEEIAAAADDEASRLPEHLRGSYMQRRINRTLRCVAIAAAKVRSALEGQNVAPASAPSGNADYLLTRLA